MGSDYSKIKINELEWEAFIENKEWQNYRKNK